MGQKIIIIVDNHLPIAMPPKKFEVPIYSNMTVIQAKSLIAGKLNPIQKPECITLISRGSMLLNDNKTMGELFIQNKQTFMVIAMNNNPDEDFQCKKLNEKEIKCDDKELNKQSQELFSIFGHISEPVIKYFFYIKKISFFKRTN